MDSDVFEIPGKMFFAVFGIFLINILRKKLLQRHICNSQTAIEIADEKEVGHIGSEVDETELKNTSGNWKITAIAESEPNDEKESGNADSPEDHRATLQSRGLQLTDSEETIPNYAVTSTGESFRKRRPISIRPMSVGNILEKESRPLLDVRMSGDGDSNKSLQARHEKTGASPTHSETTLFYTISEVIGSSGGTLAIAGCSVLIPRGALKHLTEITMNCFFYRKPFQDNTWMSMTPTIQLLPEGVEFEREIIVTLPAYFNAAYLTELPEVTIQTKQDNNAVWTHFQTMKHLLSGHIAFGVKHFTWFRAIFKRIDEKLFSRMLYFSAYLKRFTVENQPNILEFIWNLCDEKSISYSDAGMNKDHYEMVIERRTILIRFNESVRIRVKTVNANIAIEPPNILMRNDDIWPYGNLENRKCELRNIDNSPVDIVQVNYSVEAFNDEDPRRSALKEGSGRFQWTAKPRAASNAVHMDIRDSVIHEVTA